MVAEGRRKAAMLLRTLEPNTAAELLKAAEPGVVTEIAAELAYLDSSGYDPGMDEEPVREFYTLLSQGRTPEDSRSFHREVVEGAMGPGRSEEVLAQVDRMIQLRDPFRAIRSRPVDRIAGALEGESAQVAAMVLGELPPKTSAALLEELDENVQADAVQGMTTGAFISPESKLRVATAVENRLKSRDEQPAAARPKPTPKKQKDKDKDKDKDDGQHLRKVALLLRSLAMESRKGLLESLTSKDPETAKAVGRMMVVWEDLPMIGERSLQESLRSADSRQLALALVDAGPQYEECIKSNISQRARGMLDEETSLMSSPKPEEIAEAREAILDAMRDLNEKGELEFVEEN